jgi:hypothetical protein
VVEPPRRPPHHHRNLHGVLEKKYEHERDERSEREKHIEK